MLFWLVSKLHALLERFIYASIKTLVYASFCLSLAHFFGWLERWIWWIIEREACKILNHSKVTIGGFQIDWSQILQGKITFNASNIILHTPKREEWQWESPLIARVGHASVEVNAPVTLFHLVVLRVELPIEVYTVQVSDVQVFVERRDHVFNVYLLDPAVVLPPPPGPPPGPNNNVDEATSSAADDDDDIANASAKSVSTTSNAAAAADQSSSSSSVGVQPIAGTKEKEMEQAERLVNDMLHAVQSLGRAAQKGGLQNAFKQRGLELADRLRGVHKENLEQSARVLQQVGKVAVKSLQTPKKILPERNPRRTPKPVYGRVGRIVLSDLRIFTKASWIQVDEQEEQNTSDGSWNKPITIDQMIVRASELCPPMKLKDAQDLPAIYQTLDKVIEVVWRRLLAEMAKSNSGRLFQTAIGEVLSLLKSNPTKTKAITKEGGPQEVRV
jgi:hypothetical protein